MDAATNPPPATESAPPEPMSLIDRLTGVITSPGEVFDDVKASPVRNSNWALPFILVCLAGIFYTCMAFSQQAVVTAMQDQREQAIQKQVAAGKIPQAQADQAITMTRNMMTPTVMKVTGGIFALIGSAGSLFLMALCVWGGVKMLDETQVGFMKITEVCGLALVIDVLQKIIRAWLVMWKENILSTVSPTLLLANPDMTNRRDIFLSMIDPIDVWWLVVMSLGVSKVSGLSKGKSAALCFGIWFGFRIIMAFLTPAK